jgi:RimJ/RimL family protein N-acetyltransferase
LDIVQSERLELIGMGPALLEALLAGDHVLAGQMGGFQIPGDVRIHPRTLQLRLQQLQANPEVQPWLLRAMVIRHSRVMCGYIGFHSEPAPEDLREMAADGVEIGYTVGESFRRQGYAKEAALRLMQWAFERHGQRCFVLSISPDNQPSLAMAHSMGFRQIGSHMDEEDGLELYFERRIGRWPGD